MDRIECIARNQGLATTWRDDCADDEVFLKTCLDTVAHMPNCSPHEAREAARGMRDAIDGIVGCGVLSRDDVLAAADTLESLADKMHEVAP